MSLTPDQKRRYARNILLPEIGEAGQERLLASRVLVIGAGGLGSPVITYLAAAGVGTIGIADKDRVELSNLNRQIAFETGDVGRIKVEAAANHVEELNPDVKVIQHALEITEANAQAIIKDYDIVADGCDNFATRFAVHRACYALKKPYVSAAVQGWDGQISTFKAFQGAPHPCYECLVPEDPEITNACATSGVLGALTGTLGALQAMEVMKELLGIGESLSGKLMRVSALDNRVKMIALLKDPHCSVCA